MLAAMTPDETLARMRLRQWIGDRRAQRTPGAIGLRKTGWIRRKDRMFDARLVRILSFEQAFSQLTADEQTLLLAVDVERQTMSQAAHLLKCSVRQAHYLLPRARAQLAAALDRLDLL